MAKKVVVIFYEGDTEDEFYKRVISYIRQICGGRLNCKVDMHNVKGFGKYQSKVPRVFKKQVIKKYKDSEFYVLLCYDTDVFEFSSKPPINWKEIKKSLLDSGAHKVSLVGAKKSIEDWFLKDIDGVLKYLNLPRDIKISGNDGLERLQNLFVKSGKVYIKGIKSSGFIDKLDVKKIIRSVYSDIKPLLNVFGIKRIEDLV